MLGPGGFLSPLPPYAPVTNERSTVDAMHEMCNPLIKTDSYDMSYSTATNRHRCLVNKIMKTRNLIMASLLYGTNSSE